MLQKNYALFLQKADDQKKRGIKKTLAWKVLVSTLIRAHGYSSICNILSYDLPFLSSNWCVTSIRAIGYEVFCIS